MKKFFGFLLLFLLLGFSALNQKIYAFAATDLVSNRAPGSSVAFTNTYRITDGNKNTQMYSDSYPNSGLQWIQFDLGAATNINDIRIWHYFGDSRSYHDVIVQLSNDPSFASGVTTIFNNDTDNSAGKGTGTDAEYPETSSGKDISFTPVSARYVRLYSNGNTINANNHYVEVEIYDGQTYAPSTNLATNKPITSSVTFSNSSRITNGDISTSTYADSYPSSGLQWIQLDLGAYYNVNSISLWHYYGDTRIYHDVIVQLSNDPAFTSGITTVFNNDTDNSAGKGAGTDAEYTETVSGKTISFTAVNARYVRFYSRGNTINGNNHYIQVAVYGTSSSSSLTNFASGKSNIGSPVTFSNLSFITDGNKNPNMYSDSYPDSGLQWIELDLGASRSVSDIRLWHYFGDSRKYHDVIVQLSDNPYFSGNVTTVFNNDTDNSAGLGTGTNAEYLETSSGKDISFNAVNARYVRFYSSGNTINAYNHYVEIEIYGTSTSLSVKPLANASSYLNLPTYDGSDQSTHPSVQYFPDGWNGHKYWMVMTPNINQTTDVENPCIYVSENGIDWSVPAGLSNPLTDKPAIGHNCDTEIFYNSNTSELWVYYVESDDVSGSLIKLMKSGDGINWTSPQTVVSDVRGKYSSLSPTVEYISSLKKYYMWTVNTGNSGFENQSNYVERRESSDGITWSAPAAVTKFVQSNSQIWHIFIRYVPSKNEYWAMYAAYPNGLNSAYTLLYFARSSDGMTWTTYSKPALDRGDLCNWDDRQIYRSAFVYDPSSDMLKVWYSALYISGDIWKIGYTQSTYTSFFSKLTN